MIALLLEIVIAIAVSVFIISKLGWIAGIIVFFLLIGISKTALSKGKR